MYVSTVSLRGRADPFVGVRACLVEFDGVRVITDVMGGSSRSFPTSRYGADKLINSCMRHRHFMAAVFPSFFFCRAIASSGIRRQIFLSLQPHCIMISLCVHM